MKYTLLALCLLFLWSSLLDIQPAHGAIDKGVDRPSAALEQAPPRILTKLVFRGDSSYPPFEYLDSNGRPQGFNVDIIKAVAKTMQLDATIDLAPWDIVRSQLEKGEIDALLGMYRTPERDKLVDFSIPHLIVSYAVFMRDSYTLRSIEDLRDKIILVQEEDLGHDYIRENHLGSQVIVRQNWTEVLKALASGLGDCAIVSRIQGMRYLEKNNLDNIRPVGPPLLQRKYCIAVKEGDAELLAVINEGLSIIKTTGEYDAIYQKWFKAYEKVGATFTDALISIAWVFPPLLGIALLGYFWSWTLRRKVSQKTIDLKKELRERRRTEEALRESEERFRRLAENAPDVIFRLSVPTGCFEYINESALHHFGLSSSEVLQRSFRLQHIIHEDDREHFEECLAAATKSAKSTTCEYRIIDSSNEIRWMQQRSVALFDADGQVNALEGIIRDMTEARCAEMAKRRLEEQLHRAEKMETVGTLAGGVAHDLNNVLGAIVGYPDLLIADMPTNSPMRKALQTIKESGERASLIVQDLLTLARRGVAVNETCDLNAIVREYIDSQENKRAADLYPEVKIQLDLASDLLPIAGSRLHLSKVVMNIVYNGMEAVNGHGTIIVATRNIYLDQPLGGYDQVQEGEYALLEISDNGMGIPNDEIPKIFEPFYTRKEMGLSGSGLGLAVVWGTVKDHRGYIDVKSDLGQGTTISLYFPVERGAAVNVQGPQEKGVHHGHGETVLVIDDIGSQRELATAMLTKLGYKVSSVGSGKEALEWLQEEKVDLLVLDMIMPRGLDGLDTYRRVLELHPGQKAILASGYSETARVRKALLLGASLYLKKPFTLEKLAAAVSEALRGQPGSTISRKR